MSFKLLGRCLPCVFRLPHHSTRILARCNSSLTPQSTSGESSKASEQEEDEDGGLGYSIPDPVFDNTEEHYFEPTRRVPVRRESHVLDSNWEPMFFDLNEINNTEPLEEIDVDEDMRGYNVEGMAEEFKSPLHHLPIPFNRLGTLHRYSLVIRRVTQQTGKGKIHGQYSLVLVGNGDGLVGIGEGKSEYHPEAEEKAFGQAVRNLDYIDRFEGRTLWSDIDTKFGATRLVMRPRPVGFGLMCAPSIHQIFKAAGIKDASVKIFGSRNKINVTKAAIRALHAGHTPLAMGNGIGGKGRKLEAGTGMRGKNAVERERGRRILDARTW